MEAPRSKVSTEFRVKIDCPDHSGRYWILYKSVKRVKTVCKKNEAPTSKAGFHSPRVLLYLVKYSMDLTQESVNSGSMLRPKNVQPWSNRDNVIFYRDNTRLFIAALTQKRIEELGWRQLPQPKYSPDLASLDFYFFRFLYNNLNFNENALPHFSSLKLSEFHKKGDFVATTPLETEGNYVLG